MLWVTVTDTQSMLMKATFIFCWDCQPPAHFVMSTQEPVVCGTQPLLSNQAFSYTEEFLAPHKEVCFSQ